MHLHTPQVMQEIERITTVPRPDILKPGFKAPDVGVISMVTDTMVPLSSFHVNKRKPLVIIASSLSWPPFQVRWTIPTILWEEWCQDYASNGPFNPCYSVVQCGPLSHSPIWLNFHCGNYAVRKRFVAVYSNTAPRPAEDSVTCDGLPRVRRK